MKLDIKINNNMLNKIISYNIKEISKRLKLNFPSLWVYQIAIEVSIIGCFTRVIYNLKMKNSLNKEIFNIIYNICETLLIEKFKHLYLKRNINSSTAKFLRFAKICYDDLFNNDKNELLLYV